MKYQSWFPSIYDKGRIVVLPAEQPLVRRSANGAKVRESGRLEVRSSYREEFVHRGISMDYALVLWWLLFISW